MVAVTADIGNTGWMVPKPTYSKPAAMRRIRTVIVVSFYNKGAMCFPWPQMCSKISFLETTVGSHVDA